MADKDDDHPGNQRRTSGALAGAVLDLLLAADAPLTGTDILRAINANSDGPALSQTTILTILTRLQDRGLVTRFRDGRAYCYQPVTDRPGLAARRMRHVLDEEGDRDAVLARFVGDLSARDERYLRQLLGEEDG